MRKKMRLGASVILMTLAACTTTQVIEENTPIPVVPDYVKIPHPMGFDLASLKAVFLHPLAPKGVLGEFTDTCDEELRRLMSITTNKEEWKKGAAELVTQDPERMHWCFYGKISRLQDTLQNDTTWTTRQKQVLESFDFLTPIANAFLDTYHDSRYLRWATQYYSKVSEWVFFRKVVPTPENTLLLTSGIRMELEPWVQIGEPSKEESVFAKYGITLAPTIAGAINPLLESERQPASAPGATPETPTGAQETQAPTEEIKK